MLLYNNLIYQFQCIISVHLIWYTTHTLDIITTYTQNSLYFQSNYPIKSNILLKHNYNPLELKQHPNIYIYINIKSTKQIYLIYWVLLKFFDQLP